jgi:hypothetical protein
MTDLSSQGMMRICGAGDSKEVQKTCDFFEPNKDDRCRNQRFDEFCPYYEEAKERIQKEGVNANTRY